MIIACVIIGTYLYVCDQLFNKLVSKVLLGQWEKTACSSGT